ncbi:hypothetical protein GCM10022243_00610 [Saccharothrix violaceirubra]
MSCPDCGRWGNLCSYHEQESEGWLRIRDQERHGDPHVRQRGDRADEEFGRRGRLMVRVLTKIVQLVAVVLVFLLIVWLPHGFDGTPAVP